MIKMVMIMITDDDVNSDDDDDNKSFFLANSFKSFYLIIETTPHITQIANKVFSFLLVSTLIFRKGSETW